MIDPTKVTSYGQRNDAQIHEGSDEHAEVAGAMVAEIPVMPTLASGHRHHAADCVVGNIITGMDAHQQITAINRVVAMPGDQQVGALIRKDCARGRLAWLTIRVTGDGATSTSSAKAHAEAHQQQPRQRQALSINESGMRRSVVTDYATSVLLLSMAAIVRGPAGYFTKHPPQALWAMRVRLRSCCVLDSMIFVQVIL